VPAAYLKCLAQLARATPKRKSARVRPLLPGIEAARKAGQSLKEIWEALEAEGLQVSYHAFQMTVWRASKKPSAPNDWGKQERTIPQRDTARIGAGTVEERDPLANLKRLEEPRSGFHWRGTQKLQRLVHGIEDSDDKSKR
jgi:hypothetical protein